MSGYTFILGLSLGKGLYLGYKKKEYFLARVTSTVMKHHDPKQLREERVYFTCNSI